MGFRFFDGSEFAGGSLLGSGMLVAALLMGLPVGCGGTDGGNGGGDDDQKPAESVTCAEGTKLVGGECVLDSDGCGQGTRLVDGSCRAASEVCGTGTTFDEGTGECRPNSQITCGPDTVEQGGSCVSTIDLEDACQNGTVYDASTDSCEVPDDICGFGTKRDANSGKCVTQKDAPTCGDKTVYDMQSNSCVPAEKVCGQGTRYDEQSGTCRAGDVLSGDCMNPTTISSDITSDKVLPKGNCYRVDGEIVVDDAKLEIKPGVQMFFEEGAGMYVVGSNGLIEAVGTDKDEIVFAGTKEMRGWWDGLGFFNDNSNKLHHVVIKHTGKEKWNAGTNKPAAITVAEDENGTSGNGDPGKVSVQDSTIEDNSHYGVYVGNVAPSDAIDFANNTLKNNGTPMFLPAYALNGLSGTSTFKGNDNDVVQVKADYWLGLKVTVSALDVPYEILQNIRLGAKDKYDGQLIVETGVVAQFESRPGIEVEDQAMITVEGTKSDPVRFTGTNQNRGHWHGIMIGNTTNGGNKLEWLTVEYAGSGSWQSYSNSPAGITVGGVGSNGYKAAASIEHTTVRESGGYGVLIGAAMTDGSKLKPFSNNTFKNNKKAPVAVPAWTAHQLDSASTYKGNDVDAVRVYTDGVKIGGNFEWAALDVPYRVTETILVDGQGNANGQFTIAAGATVEFEQQVGLNVENGGSFHAKGTAGSPVTLTGAQQVKGFWDGVAYYETPSALNQLSHTTISYAGNSSYDSDTEAAALTLFSDYGSSKTTIKMDNLTLSNSANAGVYLEDDDSGEEIDISSCSNVTFTNNAKKVLGDKSTWNSSCGAP